MPLLLWCYNSKHHLTSTHHLTAVSVSKTQGTPFLFPIVKTDWECTFGGNPRVCETYTFSCSLKVHMVLTSQLRPTAEGPEAEQYPVRWGYEWSGESSWVRRCQDTCSSPVSPSPPSTLPCTHSLSLQWLSPSSGETTMAGSLRILYLRGRSTGVTQSSFKSHPSGEATLAGDSRSDQFAFIHMHVYGGSNQSLLFGKVSNLNWTQVTANSKVPIKYKWAWCVRCKNLDWS